MENAPRIILAAGGTGGHLWPALSLARAVKIARPEAEFMFIGTGRPLEDKIMGPTGIPREILNTSGIKGQGLPGKIRAVGQAVAATFQAVGIIREFKPDLCFGAGGYVTFPVGLAAWLCRVPVAIHEQNYKPGLSNIVLSFLARKVMVAFDQHDSPFDKDKKVVTGNPIRPEISALHRQGRNFGHRPLTVAITGGSQGAAALNRSAVPAMVALHNKGVNIQVIHQTGREDLKWARQAYAQADMPAIAEEFISDMADLYRRADLLIGRAGAITISELTAARLPSILVPLPTAADDHQTVNARRLEKLGASRVLPEKELTPESLADEVELIIDAPERLEAMSFAAGSAAQLKADEKMAKVCLQLIDDRNQKKSRKESR